MHNTKATDATVSGLYIVFWASVNNLALAVGSSYPLWSTPTLTNATMTMNNTTYYQYRSTYSGTTKVAAGGTVAVRYAFNGTVCRSGTTYITAGQAFASADRVTIQSPASTILTTCTAGNCR